MSTRHRTVSVAVVVLTVLAGGMPAAAALTTIDGHGAATGADTLTSLSSAAASPTQWNTSTNGYVEGSPTVANGTVYVGSWDGKVYALDAATGAIQWSFNTSAPVQSAPAVAGGTVYVGSNNNTLYALDASDGTKQWTFSAGDDIEAAPTVVSGTVYIGSLDTKVYALDASDGTKQWSVATDGEVRSSPTVASGTVYVGSNDGRIYAFDAADGTSLWHVSTDGWVTAAPTVANGTVYASSTDGTLYALDASDGSKQWNYTTGGAIETTPAVADGTVYIGSYDNRTYALNATDGSEQWIHDANGAVIGAPTVNGSLVYVGSADNHLYALNASTGTERWSLETNGWVFASPTVAGDTVYIGSFDTRVYAMPASQPLGRALPGPTDPETDSTDGSESNDDAPDGESGTDDPGTGDPDSGSDAPDTTSKDPGDSNPDKSGNDPGSSGPNDDTAKQSDPTPSVTIGPSEQRTRVTATSVVSSAEPQPEYTVYRLDARAAIVVSNARNADAFETELGSEFATEPVTLNRLAVDLATTNDSATFDVRTPTATPETVPPLADGSPVGYFAVDAGVSESDIETARISFSLNRSVLPAGTNYDAVQVYRYHKGTWQPLETEHRGNGSFVATTPGFSWFAVSVQPPATDPAVAEQRTDVGASDPNAASTPAAGAGSSDGLVARLSDFVPIDRVAGLRSIGGVVSVPILGRLAGTHIIAALIVVGSVVVLYRRRTR